MQSSREQRLAAILLYVQLVPAFRPIYVFFESSFGNLPIRAASDLFHDTENFYFCFESKSLDSSFGGEFRTNGCARITTHFHMDEWKTPPLPANGVHTFEIDPSFDCFLFHSKTQKCMSINDT